MIPCLCLFTALRTLVAEPPVNKKRTRTLFHKELGFEYELYGGALSTALEPKTSPTGDSLGIIRKVEIEHDPAILSHRISRFFLNCILNKVFVSYQLWFHRLSTMDGCGLHVE